MNERIEDSGARRAPFALENLMSGGYDVGARRDWHTEGFSEGSPIVVMAGAEKRSKKSWTALAHGVACITGGSWLNQFKVDRVGDVVLLDGENGPFQTKRRLLRLCRGAGVNPDLVIPRFHYVYSKGIKLHAADDGWKSVLEQVSDLRNRGVVLSEVIIDPFANHLDGDENAKVDVLHAMEQIAKLRDLADAQILVLHHLNKSGSASGSRAIATRADLFLEGTDGSTVYWEAIGRTIRLTDPLSAPFTILAHHEHDDDDSIASTTLTLKFKGGAAPGELSANAQLVLEYLKTNKGIVSQTKIAESIHRSGKDTGSALKELSDAGLARAAGRKWEVPRDEPVTDQRAA